MEMDKIKYTKANEIEWEILCQPLLIITENDDFRPFAQTDELLATFRSILDFAIKICRSISSKTSFSRGFNYFSCKTCCPLGVPESGHLYLDPAIWSTEYGAVSLAKGTPNPICPKCSLRVGLWRIRDVFDGAVRKNKLPMLTKLCIILVLRV